FNMEAGLTAVDDTLPERFSCETIPVAGEDKYIPTEALRNMRADYYMLRGWDEGGKPVNRPD
ncbi:MAG: aldehyde ferredoxin oxidoreductase C-terminal domain-containing protein, partial [Acidobacteria bacterium]|nr:aldehyde ferredoxin oxidoreductase C-terminal domain-containing protein [Acidobacteriota bacterium]